MLGVDIYFSLPKLKNFLLHYLILHSIFLFGIDDNGLTLFYILGENKHKWKVNKRLKTSLHVRNSTTIRAIQQFLSVCILHTG